MCGNWHDISWQLVRCIVTIGAIYRTSCHERQVTHWTVSCFRYKDTHFEWLSESYRACSINDGKRSLGNFPRRSRRFRRYKKQSAYSALSVCQNTTYSCFVIGTPGLKSLMLIMRELHNSLKNSDENWTRLPQHIGKALRNKTSAESLSARLSADESGLQPKKT